ncbi:MAG: hypothetical protein IIB60_01275 [Planctomycetes bacterium]|nr:hypothetical protein [Planctomycetota bacterium]
MRGTEYAIRAAATVGLTGVLMLAGCQAAGPGGWAGRSAQASAKSAPHERAIRAVRCIYDRRPWLNVDKAGDRDPEGIWYRVYLDAGDRRGVWREGMFHIEMYRIDRVASDEIERILVSDWHYPTSTMGRLGKGMMGEGYIIKLVWADKTIAGKEVELITQFEDTQGRKARSGTKRFRVPKYRF